jgi:hypothetical protein
VFCAKLAAVVVLAVLPVLGNATLAHADAPGDSQVTTTDPAPAMGKDTTGWD